MADSAAHPVKRCLGNVAMHVVHVRKVRDKTYSALRWKIENFLKLKDTVRYKWQVETLDWILKLDKKRYCVTVTIESRNKYGVTRGFVCYESLKFSEPVTFNEVFGSMYKTEFNPKIVNHKDNAILKKYGRLELYFPFEVKVDLPTSPRIYYEKRCPTDEIILSSEVTKSICRPQCTSDIQLTDFEIIVDKETFYVHKAILRMRSPFLKSYIDEHCKDGKRGVMRLSNTIPRAMTIVLQYIYKGISEIPKNVDLRIWIFKLAHFFRIAQLREVYLDLLLQDIDETNVERIKEAGMSTGTSSLIQSADACLSGTGSSLSEEEGLYLRQQANIAPS